MSATTKATTNDRETTPKRRPAKRHDNRKPAAPACPNCKGRCFWFTCDKSRATELVCESCTLFVPTERNDD